MELALEAGADDVERLGDLFEIRCDPTAFQAVRDALAKANLSTTMAEMTRRPKDPMDVDAEMGRKIIRLLEALDDHDDVQSVYTNAKVTEEMMGS